MNSDTIVPKFLLLGDSLTELAQFGHDPEWMETSGTINIGWQVLLAEKYVRRVDLINRGMGGWNTRWTVEKLEKLRSELKSEISPAIVTIWFGTNDSTNPIDGVHKFMHVPVDEYEQNLLTILTMYKEMLPKAKIFMVTPPPFVSKKATDAIVPYVNAVHAVVNSSNNSNVFVVDIFNAFSKISEKELPSYFVTDGVHFSGKGNYQVFKAMLDAIDSYAKELSPDSCELIMPEFTEWEP